MAESAGDGQKTGKPVGLPSVRLSGVVKGFSGREALAGISADILPGQLTGLVGPDGAGKTTLLRLIAGLLRPDQGSITLMAAIPSANRAKLPI